MITLHKLREYEEHHGYYDGFYQQKLKNSTNLTSDDEWDVIDRLVQAFRLVQNQLASPEFEEELNKKLEENCDSEETMNQLKRLADKEW